MNILTLCDQGNNRSVVLARILRGHYKQRDVIPMGAFTSSQQTLVMLYDWADKILITHGKLIHLIAPEYKDKVVLIDLGPDIWGYKPSPDLLAKAEMLLAQNMQSLHLDKN